MTVHSLESITPSAKLSANRFVTMIGVEDALAFDTLRDWEYEYRGTATATNANTATATTVVCLFLLFFDVFCIMENKK